MTDPERKEVEEFVSVLQLLDIPDNLKRAIGVFVINAGYKRSQDNNALVPLDEMKVVETIFTWDEIGALTHTGKKTLARAICSKFAIPAVTAQPKHGKLVEALKEILPFVDGYYEHCKCGRCLAYRKCEQALKEYEQ